jgi:hypothetical protein
MMIRDSAHRVKNPNSAMILQYLNPSTLRDLAAAIDYGSPKAKARRELTPDGIERLAALLVCGGTPTVGFFLRHKVGV